MDNRKPSYHRAVSACLGMTFLICFTIAMGKVGFGKPKKDPLITAMPMPLSNYKGGEIAIFKHDELYSYLSGRNFKIPKSASLHEMRRCYLAYSYQPLFDSVSALTNIQPSVLFAYFIMEATKEGVESELFTNTWNPGGVKYKGKHTPYYAYDDCYVNGKAVPCAFENPGSFDNAVKLWAEVFNAPRYSACKDLSIRATCECLERAGYHSAKNFKQRARIANAYATYLKYAPDVAR